MPCKIKIKQNITEVIEERTNPVMDGPLAIAQAVARGVNDDFEVEVVRIEQSPTGKLARKINIPTALIDEYYENELYMEEAEIAEAIVEEEQDDILEEGEVIPNTDAMLQVEEMKASRAAEITLEKVKLIANQLGIKFESLVEYSMKNPAMDVNGALGVADLVKGTVAIAKGREGTALVEEVVHMATALVEQKNPGLMTNLISKIGEYKIYKQVFETYKNNKNYQLADGKPDIRKIKKEAVDKLIAELIVFQSEGSTEFPELREKATRNTVQEWWGAVLNFVKDLFNRSDIDLFGKTAQQILEGGIEGDVSELGEGIFLQTGTRKRNKVVDDAIAKYMEEDAKMVLNTPKDDRHYMYDGTRVATSVTQFVKKGKPEIKATPEQQIEYDQMKEWGSAGHKFIEDYIKANLIDEEGYALETTLNTPIETGLNSAIQTQLKGFCKRLIRSYPENTRFLLEKMVINKQKKGMMASTVDFKAFIPVTKEDGTEDMLVDTLDWKFTINKEGQEDVPFYKQKDWKPQMEQYIEMDYATYGVKSHQTRMSRMIPFSITYGDVKVNKKKVGIVPKAMQIGNLDPKKEPNMYLIPVPIITESTGVEEVDDLVQQLQSQWDKLWSKRTGDELDYQKKMRDLEELSSAIRHLQLKMSFGPLRNVAKTFLNNSLEFIKDLNKTDISTLTKEQLNSLLFDLHSYKDSAEKFSNLDRAFQSYKRDKKLSKEEAETLATFRNISIKTENMIEELESFERKAVMTLGVKEGIVSEDNQMSILEAEAAIDGFSAASKESTKLSSKIINLTTNMIMKASELTNRKTAKQIREFGKLLLPLENEARAQGKSAFDMIAKIEDGKLHLFKKLSPEFWKGVEQAKKDKNRKFFKENLNMQEYVKDIEEAIKKGEEDLDKREFDADPQTAERFREIAKDRLRNSLDIRSTEFNGWEMKSFNYYFNRNIKEEGNYSKEYQRMAQSPAALAVWEMFTQLNREAKKMGYLGDQGMSFLPLIEATTMDKFRQTNGIFAAPKDFFKELYTVTVNEENQLSQVDPETGKVKRQTPKFFTKTDKEVQFLSRDLNMMGSLWIQSLNNYQNAKDMEHILMTLDNVEKAKGTLVMENGRAVMVKGRGKVNYDDSTNHKLLQVVIDDFLFGLGENLDSYGNVNLSAITGKFSKDAESKEKNVVAVKKVIKNADTLVQALAVGLKPMIGIANWFGVNFQAYINGSNMYSWGEFRKNNFRVSTGQISEIERGLLDLVHPLNENITLEERRKLAKQHGLPKYLSTWSFTDVMMITNSFPERKLQYANALSFNQNSMVVDGKIVNIRQMLRKQDSEKKYAKDASGKYIMSVADRKALENSFEVRVKALQESSSLPKIAKIVNDEMVIPGVSEEALAEYTVKIKEFMRTLNGQMNENNKAGYRRDTIMSSFMMFKNWIPKLMSVRTTDLTKAAELDEWQYGRTRVFLKTFIHMAKGNLKTMSDIINGTEEGLELLDKMLKEKKEAYFLKTGQELEITQEEFNDLIRQKLGDQVKELKLLLGIVAVVFAASLATPPEDFTDQEKNLFKWGIKQINKISDEITFYYNPISFEKMTSGRLLPAAGLLSKVINIVDQVGSEAIGSVFENDEMSKKAHGLKYTLDIIPGLSQFQREVLPYLYPELAKEMGIKVTTERMSH